MEMRFHVNDGIAVDDTLAVHAKESNRIETSFEFIHGYSHQWMRPAGCVAMRQSITDKETRKVIRRNRNQLLALADEKRKNPARVDPSDLLRQRRIIYGRKGLCTCQLIQRPMQLTTFHWF